MAQAQSKSFRDRAGMSGSPDSGRTDLGSRASSDGRGLEMARRMGETFFEGYASMNREFFRFMSTRFQEDMKMARAFASCRHPSDFVETELRFMQSLVRQYSENANQMLSIAAQVAGHSLDDMEDRISDAVRRPGAASAERSAA